MDEVKHRYIVKYLKYCELFGPCLIFKGAVIFMLSWTPSGSNSAIFDMFFSQSAFIDVIQSNVKVSNNKGVTKIN